MKTIKTTGAAAVLALALAAGAAAKPAFMLPRELPAAPGVPCRVYFARAFDSVKPSAYAFEALSKAGTFLEDGWSWTPTDKDAGRRVDLVFNAWTDDGLVDSATTTVVVASVPSAELKARRIALAYLTASASNCLFTDRLRERMREGGFANYVAVGSHTGASSSTACDPEKGAPHDGYGGFAWGDFLTRYALTVEEIDNFQSEAEREQLRSFGIKLAPGNAWRKGLLKSPLVRIRDGKKVVDVQAWFDKVNGGRAPDYVFITLGGNGVATVRPELVDAAIARQMVSARTLLGHLRAAAPQMRIVVTSAFGGSIEQTGWGRNYGALTSAFVGNRNRFRYDRAVARLVAEQNDPNIVFANVSLGLDPVGGYPRGGSANALHATKLGGQMFADGLYAWLVNDLERTK